MPTTPVIYDGPLPQLEIIANGMHNSTREEVAFTGGGSTIAPNWGSWLFQAGLVGIAYDQEWDMPTSDRPITYSIVTGTLPTGLSLIASGDNHSAKISGTPSSAGSSTFTLRASNSAGISDQSFTIVVTNPSGGETDYGFAS
jgi:hypothetical protein